MYQGQSTQRHLGSISSDQSPQWALILSDSCFAFSFLVFFLIFCVAADLCAWQYVWEPQIQTLGSPSRTLPLTCSTRTLLLVLPQLFEEELQTLKGKVSPWLLFGNLDFGRVPTVLPSKNGSLYLNCFVPMILFIPNTYFLSGVWNFVLGRGRPCDQPLVKTLGTEGCLGGSIR